MSGMFFVRLLEVGGIYEGFEFLKVFENGK
jgi:hypothetical protein